MSARRLTLLGIVAGIVVAIISPSASAETADATTRGSAGLVRRATDGRLSLGLRWSRLWLDDSRRYGPDGLDNRSGNAVNFLGSIWGLDPVRRSLPSPYVEYRVWSVLGVGAGFDEARVRTLDWADNEKTTTAGDGDLRLRGVQVYAFAAVPNRTRFTPQARVGYGRYGAAFFESPGWSMPGRDFEVQDTKGWLLGASLRCRVFRQVSVEAAYDRLDLADVQAKARLGGGAHKKGVFPVRSDVLRAGMSYGF